MTTGGPDDTHPAAPAAAVVAAAPPRRRFRTPSRPLLLASVLLQLALAVPFGHSYDMRVFMVAGRLVGRGHSPYMRVDLSHFFHHPHFDLLTTIGYPPPWPLVLGLLYRVSNALGGEFLVYNLILKLPVIAATVGLAYLVAALLQGLGATPAATRRAWIFLLFNPLILYTGAAWGQIDVIVTLLAVGSLALLASRRRTGSAALLALSVTTKPTALPLLPVAVLYGCGRSTWQAVRYAAAFVAVAVVLYAAPFVVLGWDPTPVLRHWNAQMAMNGSLSWMTVVRLLRHSAEAPATWWPLGLVWIPALALAIVALRRGDGGLVDLVRKSAALVLVFFLTRTWLAEPDVVLLVPLLLILTTMGELHRRALTAVWVLPLAFTVANLSPLQLLFPAFPHTMDRALAAAVTPPFDTLALVTRAALVALWQLAGWWIVVCCYRQRPVPAAALATGDATGGLAAWR